LIRRSELEAPVGVAGGIAAVAASAGACRGAAAVAARSARGVGPEW